MGNSFSTTRTVTGWISLSVLALGFVSMGMLREPLLDGIQQLISPKTALPAHDLASLRRLKQEVFTTRPLLPMALYGGSYVLVSMLLLHVLLGAQWRRTRIVAACFGAALAVAGVLLALSKVLHLAPLLTPPARALIDLLTSPTPVLLVLAVYWLVVPRLQAPSDPR